MVGVGVVVVIAVAVAVAAAVTLAARGPRPGRVARVLRVVAVASTVAVAALVVSPAWRDSGAFALLLVGVPVLCAACILAVRVGGRAAALLTWAAAAVMLAWTLVTSLGLGAYFLGPSALMVAAAVAATSGAGARRPDATRVETEPEHGNRQPRPRGA